MWPQFTGPVFLRIALWRTAPHKQMPAFITPYISQWMTVKSQPYSASQMDKQKNIIVSQPNHHWHLYCLRRRGTTCLHIVSGPIHSSISHLLVCSLPPDGVPVRLGWNVPGGVKKKRMHGWISPVSPQWVYKSRKDKTCVREHLFCALAKSFSYCLISTYLSIYSSGNL